MSFYKLSNCSIKTVTNSYRLKNYTARYCWFIYKKSPIFVPFKEWYLHYIISLQWLQSGSHTITKKTLALAIFTQARRNKNLHLNIKRNRPVKSIPKKVTELTEAFFLNFFKTLMTENLAGWETKFSYF